MVQVSVADYDAVKIFWVLICYVVKLNSVV